jgi:hypothetical protein
MCDILVWYTGRFIMFFVITNIYNKKTKESTLIELFTATRKLIFIDKVRCVHHGWHGTHRYDIQSLATYASTRVHRYSSLLQWSAPIGQRGHVGGSSVYFARNARCTVTTDLLVWYSNTHRTQRKFEIKNIKRLLSRSGHFLIIYNRIA